MKIEIFGPGCARCKQTERNVREALSASGIEAEIIKVEDVRQYAARGVVFTPAVAIDGELKCTGRIPKSEEVQEWLSHTGVRN
jgi:small redox-active disulfide protein 2